MAAASLIHLDTDGLAPALPDSEAQRSAGQLGEWSGTEVVVARSPPAGARCSSWDDEATKKLLGQKAFERLLRDLKAGETGKGEELRVRRKG